MEMELFIGRYPYYLIAALVVVGLYGITWKRNMLKKVIGMTIFQTAIYLFFIQGATKMGATIPIYDPERGLAHAEYLNPLPQVMILTAIVVGVAVTGIALALLLRVQRSFGTLDEEKVIEQMREGR